VIADGGGDHAVKLWNARAPGSRTCNPGQAPAADGAITTLYRINGWSTALQFSPDGRFLLGASRDRAIRLWKIAPGPHQFEVVALWWDGTAKQFLSVRWAPDGRAIAAGDRRGAVTLWSFDPEVDLWDGRRHRPVREARIRTGGVVVPGEPRPHGAPATLARRGPRRRVERPLRPRRHERRGERYGRRLGI
jgi:WD40 repeat protein